MDKRKVSIALGTVCLILTLCIVVQLKTIKNTIQITDPTFAENELRDEVLKWKEKYDNCYNDLEKAEKELEKQREKATQNDSSAVEKEEEIKLGNTYLGFTDVTAKGIVITLRDNQSVTSESIGAFDNISNYVVHDIDILCIVNELKNAGAEAISINEQRIVPTTSITCAGNVAQINGEKVGAPFVIKAIGIPESLYDALARPGGYIEVLKSDGIITKIEKQNNIQIPKYNGVLNYKYIKEEK